MIGRMTKRPIILASLLISAASLTACAPNTDLAYVRCVDEAVSYIDKSTMTNEEYVERSALLASACQKAREADPVAFNREWS